MQSPVKVLIVDDSAIVRQALTQIFGMDPRFRVIGTASDPLFAISKIQIERPDVITLDIEMPKMDGLSFLKKIMSQNPIPTVIISSFAPKDSSLAIKAYELGAIDVLLKPDLSRPENITASMQKICDTVMAAAMARTARKTFGNDNSISPKYNADAVIPKATANSSGIRSAYVVAVGASTGGTEAIRIFLEALHISCPGIVIVQHMPEVFTRSFADRLNQLCRIDVKEAENNDIVRPGRALIAPGNKHMVIKSVGDQNIVRLLDGPPVNRHKPAVDVLFRSVAQIAGPKGIGILMTGMGDDGAVGLLEMKESGAFTIAQDERSCIVFGMPKEAIKLGAAKEILPLEKIAPLHQ
jgi:two-component system chemotaxis response regulator CheB